MFSARTTFVGIDPTAGQRPMTYAALGDDLRLVALGRGDIHQVLAFVAGLQGALVAISAPRQPNQRLMQDAQFREQLSPPPRPGRWVNLRLAEYQLRQHNIRCPHTDSVAEKCPQWMRVGFTLFQRLGSLGYLPYPGDALLQLVEVYPHACFTVLLGQAPFPKKTVEGRIQRQLLLYEEGLHINDPMRFFEEITRHRLLQGILPLEGIHTPVELDAIVSAYAAWIAVHRPERISMLGDEGEGQMLMPAAELKRRYPHSRSKRASVSRILV